MSEILTREEAREIVAEISGTQDPYFRRQTALHLCETVEALYKHLTAVCAEFDRCVYCEEIDGRFNALSAAQLLLEAQSVQP